MKDGATAEVSYHHAEKDLKTIDHEHRISDTDSTTDEEIEFVKVKELEILYSQNDNWKFRVALFVAAFLFGMGQNLDASTRTIYTGYATGSFSQHSLLSTVQVINQVVGSVAQIVFARLSDHFGRLNLLLASILLHCVGTIIESQSYDTGRYAAGAVFWFAGYSGITIQLMVLMSDFSPLRWRLLFQYAPYLPYIIITWVVGDIVDAANPIKHWSWDIAMWAFILPLSSLPLISILLYIRWKASKTDEWKALKSKTEKNNTLLQVASNTFWHLDSIGLILISVCLGCILVPLTLAGGVTEKWRDGRIIAVLVIGGVMFPVFLLWEKYGARNPILSVKQATDRGIWAPFCSSICCSIIYLLVTDYLYPVLLVGMNQSVKSASMIVWLPSFMGVVLSPLVSLGLWKLRRTKPFAIAGTLIYTMSTGLYYRYRGGAESRSGVIAGSLCLGMGSDLLNYVLIVSIQSISTHDQMATVTGIYMALSKVGSAVGAAISGSLWTQKMFKEISKRMKDPQLALAAYADPYTFIATYTWGTPERVALKEAYRAVQRLITIVALAFCVPFVICVFFCKDKYLTSAIAAKDGTLDEEAEKRSDDPMLDWVLAVLHVRARPKKHQHVDNSSVTSIEAEA